MSYIAMKDGRYLYLHIEGATSGGYDSLLNEQSAKRVIQEHPGYSYTELNQRLMENLFMRDWGDNK